MIWTIIDRIVHLTFLLLAIVIMLTMLNMNEERNSTKSLELSVTALNESLRKIINSNLSYLENRINRVGQASDEYQSSTSNRITILETKVELMERENKTLKMQNKIVNNNQSNATVINGKQQ